MLSSLLKSINEQFAGKSYWLGSMLPLVLFVIANALVIPLHYPQLGQLLSDAKTLDEKSLMYSAILATLLALAYVLSMMSSLMLEALEGRLGPFRWLYGPLYAAHSHILRGIDRDLHSAKVRQKEIESASIEWNRSIQNISESLKRRCVEVPSRKEAFGWYFTPVGRKIAVVRFLASQGLMIRIEHLDEAVRALKDGIEQNKVVTNSMFLKAIEDVRFAIPYTLDRYQFKIRRLVFRRMSSFPGVSPETQNKPEGPTANNILAPTKMGNIGRAMTTYALMRYQLDLDIFWTRLQNSLQKDAKDYYLVLQDIKVQVDCSTALFWLSSLFTIFWIPSLLLWFTDSSVREFLVIGIAGTLVVLGSYRVACESYRVFAEVMKSSVDLFRFQVLKDLHVQLPVDSEAENDLWFRLGGAIGFASKQDFKYRHDP
jgi:hypothetical protein